MTIHKYPLLIPKTVVTMPAGARILHVGDQGDVLTLWALVNPTQQRTETRTFLAIATGGVAGDQYRNYIGTVLFNRGGQVWHVFEATIFP